MNKELLSTLVSNLRRERQIKGLWPALKGSLAKIYKPCIRKKCPLCERGDKHPAWILTTSQRGRRRCLYVPEELVPTLQQAICRHTPPAKSAAPMRPSCPSCVSCREGVLFDTTTDFPCASPGHVRIDPAILSVIAMSCSMHRASNGRRDERSRSSQGGAKNEAADYLLFGCLTLLSP